MIPPRFAHATFSFILSGGMSFLVSGVATFRALGPVEGFFRAWISGWLPSWMVAFPAAFLFAPVARRLVARWTRPE